MYKYLLSFALLLLLPFDLAQAAPVDFFTVPARDISLSVIGVIFGTIDPALPGVGSNTTIFSSLFLIFNQIALAVGMVIVGYSAITGTIHTAHEGTPLGEKLSSTWTPFRMAVGIGLLLPRAGGYCMAQIAVMWLVLMGVGAADSMWGSVLTYLDSNSLYQSGATTTNPYYTDLGRVVDNIIMPALGSMTCVEYGNNYPDATTVAMNTVNGQYPYIGGIALDAHNNTALIFSRGNNSGATPTFLNLNSIDCGEYRLPAAYGSAQQTALSALYQAGGPVDSLAAKIVNYEFNYGNGNNHYIPTAADVTSLLNLAGSITTMLEQPAANAGGSTPNTSFSMTCGLAASNANAASGKYIGLVNGNSLWSQNVQEYWHCKGSPPERSQALSINGLIATYNSFYANSDSMTQNLADSGWMIAGNYYRAIMMRSPGSGGSNATPPIPGYPSSVSQPLAPAYLGDSTFTNLKAALDSAVLAAGNAANSTAVKPGGYSNALGSLANLAPNPSNLSLGPQQGLAYLNQIGGNFSDNGDPFAAAVQLGTSLMETAAVLITITIPTASAIAMGVAGICSGIQPARFGVAAFLYDFTFPLVLALAGFSFSVGSILGIYIPMIPFLIYLATAIGWVLSVIESMVAAPLVGLGLVWPDAQHEILGRAEPAVMMVLNLMLRPSLIVVGLFFGMLVCNFMLKLCNLGFTVMIRFGDFGIDDAVGQYVILTAYMAAVVVVVTRSFSLIHQVPDKVLSWIGDHTQYVGGGEDFLQAAKGGVEAGSSAVSEGAKATASNTRAATKGVQKKRERELEKKRASGGAGGGGKGGSSSGA